MYRIIIAYKAGGVKYMHKESNHQKSKKIKEGKNNEKLPNFIYLQ